MMSTVTADIEVDAPIRTVYNQWTQFEDFPRFMSAVESIRQLDDRHMHWIVNVGGVQREFDAEVTDQVPDQHIAWASADERMHSGVVRFRPTGANSTEVSLEMRWTPESFTEKVGAAVSIDDAAARRDLGRFKEFVEDRDRETGAWRGEIHDGGPSL